LSCQRSPPTVVCSRRMRANGNGGQVRRDQHRCHSLVKALFVGSCSCKPISTGQTTSAIRLHSRPLQQTDAATDLDVSHTKCASLETDAQQQWPDKKTVILITRGTDVATMIAIRSWRDVTIIDHSNDPTSTALHCTM